MAKFSNIASIGDILNKMPKHEHGALMPFRPRQMEKVKNRLQTPIVAAELSCTILADGSNNTRTRINSIAGIAYATGTAISAGNRPDTFTIATTW